MCQQTGSKLAYLRPLRETHISKNHKKENTDNDGINTSSELFRRSFASWDMTVGKLDRKKKKMHWLTYRTCVRRHGQEWTSKSKDGATHCWMDTM